MHCYAMLIVWHFFFLLSMKTSSFPSVGWGQAGWQCECVHTSKSIRNWELHKLNELLFLLLLLSELNPSGQKCSTKSRLWLVNSFLLGPPIAPPGKFWIFYNCCFYGCAISLRLPLMWFANLASIVGFIAFRRSWQINYFCSILILLCSLIRRGKLRRQWIFGPWNMQKCKCKYPAGRSFIMLNLST